MLAWGGNTPANAEDKLKKIIGSEVFGELYSYRQSYLGVKTQSQWFNVLQMARKLSPKISPPLSQLHQSAWNNPRTKPLDFGWVEPMTPGLKSRLVAEGTELVMALHYPTFTKLAQQTPEKGDDQLMALLQKARGEYSTNWPNWFAQTWDYGGCTHLGSGLHLQLWQELQRLQGQAPLFAPELTELRNDLLADILQVRSFCQPQSQVLKELSQFFRAPGLSTTELQNLKKRGVAVQKGKDLEFNCLTEMGKCHFGA